MSRSTINYIGVALFVAAVLSYLAGIWTTETTSENFGLTGVLFMFSGIAALVTAPFVTDSTPRRADHNDY